MYAMIEQLRTHLALFSQYKHVFLYTKDSYYESQMRMAENGMKSLLNQIAIEGCRSDIQKYKLKAVLIDIDRLTDGKLRPYISRIEGKISTDRRLSAIEFCKSSGKVKDADISSVCRGIDFSKEVYRGTVHSGETLFQWCLVTVDGKYELYRNKDGKDDFAIGNCFAPKPSPMEKLGLSKYASIFNSDGENEGTATRILYCFEFPFDVDCLISNASGIIDNWSNAAYQGVPEYLPQSGNSVLNVDYEGFGMWADGGAVQYFIPLDYNQRKALASHAARV